MHQNHEKNRKRFGKPEIYADLFEKHVFVV